MSKVYLFAMLMAFSSFLPQATTRQDEQVLKAAEGQMEVYLNKIEPGKQPAYGFLEEDDLDLCNVGKPYRVLEFNKEFFNCKQPIENAEYISIKNEWRVPVMFRGKYRTLLTVNGNPSNYSVTGMGDPELARELQQVIAGIDEKDEFYIIRIYPLLAEFFVHENEHSFINAQFIPLASARAAIPGIHKKEKPYYTLFETEQLVKEALSHQK